MLGWIAKWKKKKINHFDYSYPSLRIQQKKKKEKKFHLAGY